MGKNSTFMNCLQTSQVNNFFRLNGTTLTMRNSYGPFTSGYNTTNQSWAHESNYLGSDITFDSTTYRILDNESQWEGQGTGENPDGSTANRGVYGGEYSWDYNDNIFN